MDRETLEQVINAAAQDWWFSTRRERYAAQFAATVVAAHSASGRLREIHLAEVNTMAFNMADEFIAEADKQVKS